MNDPIIDGITEEDLRALESMMDRAGVTQIVLALSRICDKKAKRFCANWQDAGTANLWDRWSRAFDQIHRRV